MEANGQLGKPKPVHRIAFFSRLDERKGIKLFVEAVSLLPHHKRPDFEVCHPDTLHALPAWLVHGSAQINVLDVQRIARSSTFALV